jgi:3-oxoacyl-[acyl-carrier protein] reductase
MLHVEGKVVLITGAARGLGRRYCEALAAEGASVVGVDVADCGDTVASVTGAGGQALGAKVDVTDVDSCRAAVAATLERFGRLDGLVNNAALYATLTSGPFDRIPEDEWDATMSVNVTGIWNMCRAAVPAMKEAGGGSIVNISSLAAVYGLANALHYTTSKGAVIGLTRGLARELGRHWIRVNAVAPSAVETEGTTQFMGENKEHALDVIAKQQALRRTLDPSDVAGTIVYLMSDASKFVTAQTLMVDGGTVAT